MCTTRDAALDQAAAARRREHVAELAQLRLELSKQAKVALAARRDEVRQLQQAARRRLELDLAHRACLAVDAARAEEARLAREQATQRHNTAEDKRRRTVVRDRFHSKHRPVSEHSGSEHDSEAVARRRLDAELEAARGRLAARMEWERAAVLREVEERWWQRLDARRRRRANVAAAALDRTQAVAGARAADARRVAAAAAAAPSAPPLLVAAAQGGARLRGDGRAVDGEAAARAAVPSGHAEPGHGVPTGLAVRTMAWASTPAAWMRRAAAAGGGDGGWGAGRRAGLEWETARVVCR
jgi:dTMP kinase